MKILKIDNLNQAKKEILKVGSTLEGANIMSEKAIFIPLKLKDIDTRAANILKQTMLSKGGEAAISSNCIDFSKKTSDVLLLGTLHQYKLAIPVLKKQPFKLNTLAEKIEQFLKNNYIS